MMNTEGTDKLVSYVYLQAERYNEITEDREIFAPGCSFYKIVLLFFIGAFLGDIIETISCRMAMGVWMSRTSVVWGHFSVVWGLGLAVVTVLLYKYRSRSGLLLFFTGTLLGGVYEYVCSIFTEKIFGTIFWDYSAIPFNLAGRVNLLYSFCWGIVVLVWFKKIYPFLSGLIEKIPKRKGAAFTWLLIIFMAGNVAVSGMVLNRYNERKEGAAADTAAERWIDHYYDDERMAVIYPNAKSLAD